MQTENLASSPTTASTVLEPGAVIKHYELIRKLGEGGMGLVFLARDICLARLVAIKFLLKHTGPAAERFLAEARMTAQCKHENIVVIHDVDEIDAKPYMVLEYIEGHSLRDVLSRQTNHNVATAIELMLPVARALASAHAMGIVHRDLKPENILLSNAGPVKVLDFGIAKQVGLEFAKTMQATSMNPAEDTQLTQSGMIVGTMPYMSPEQWLGLPIDGRTDIWAVGLILFELATGAHLLGPNDKMKWGSVSVLDTPMPSARDNLPHSPELADIIDRCMKKHTEQRLDSAKTLVEALEKLVAKKHNVNAIADGTSPFAGLSAFQESDAGRFFGRDNEIAAVVGRLRQQQLVTVIGASGAGKSSFVRAGVIPALKRAGRELETFIVRPGRRPLAALADVLAFLADTASNADEADLVAIANTLRTEPGLLGARLRARCRKRGTDHRVLLFVDQLEELYTQGIDPHERAAFCTCIEGVADDASSPLRVIMTIRADFLDRVSEDQTFSSGMARGLYFFPPMELNGLRDALEKPLAALGYQFEDEALRDEMLGALAGTKSPLPVLQFTASQLWEARDREGKTLTWAAYQALGGVAGALSTHADAVLSAMSLSEQRMARVILMRLVSPERTRAMVRLDELYVLSDDRERVEHVVQLLRDARLLSIETGGEREGKTVELTHESLIDRWSKLRQWLEENEKDAVFVAELRNAATQWEKNHRAEGLLWRDQAAAEAGQWLARNKEKAGNEGSLGIGKREFSYLEAVVELSQRTRRRRRQATGAVIVFLSGVALVVSVLGLKANHEARRADAKADEARKNADEAQKSADDTKKKATEARNATRMASAREHLADPTLVLSLMRELEPTEALPPRWSELARWATFQSIAEMVLSHQDPVYSASFSPDGKRIVTTSREKIARVWNTNGTAEPVILDGHQDAVLFASFSPDGARIVTTSRDKTVRVWNADGQGEPLILKGHQDAVQSASFSPEGKRIVTTSKDKTARVWNTDGQGEPLILKGHQDEVQSASFSPDGSLIVTTSKDKTARVWHANGAAEPLILQGHDDVVASASFSPDAKRIVTASWDKTARLWSADGQGKPLILKGHDDVVTHALFSPDGARIVTASFDKTARVFRTDGQGEPLILKGHQAAVISVSFRHDGARIVTASLDKTARVWNADGQGEPLILEGHQAAVYSASFSRDGARIVTASLDKTARVWNAASTRLPLHLRGQQDSILSASFSPNGAYIVTASGDKTVRVFHADGQGEPLMLHGHQGIVYSASFSPDGARIVTGSLDKTARVWNADGKGEPLILKGHRDLVYSASFSPDGTRIVTASFDKTARVWSADGKGEPLILEGHQDGIISASFSPDGARIVTASKDKTARVWNTDGQGEPLILEGHEDFVYSAVFSPDGTRIVTTSGDKTARVWNANGQGAPLILKGHTAPFVVGGPGGRGAFSPDGRRFVTISDDKTLRVWNIDGQGEPAILRMPDLGAAYAAFSPDGQHIVTVSHSKLDPVTGKTAHWATVWPTFEPMKSPNDAELWLATRYCPPVELRVELLGVSKEEAAEQSAACNARVAEAFEHASATHGHSN